MADTITIRVGRQKIEAQPGQKLIEVLQQNQIDIPNFCYETSAGKKVHTCLVEVKGQEGLQNACELEVADKMRVQVNSGLARQQRREALQLAFIYQQNLCQQDNAKACAVVDKIKAYLETGAKDLKNPEQKKYHTMAESIEIDTNLCIGCGKCVKACLQKEVGYLKLVGEGKDKKVAPNGNPKISCIYCGQCTIECPVHAIREQSQVLQVEQALADPDKIVIVQMAPSIRTSIGEEFGMEPGTNVVGKMYTAFRQLGFDKVFDVNMGADITTLVEAAEIVEELKHGGKNLPMFNSCCPSWVQFVMDYYPEFVSHMAEAKSPQIHAGGAYKTWWAEKEGIDPHKIVVVSIMPCTSKKHEARLHELSVDGMNPVDYVLTTRETAHLLKKNNIDLPSLEDSEVDSIGEYSGAAAIYGASGGVLESAMRTATWMLEGKDLPKLEFEEVRGSEGIKKAEIEIAGQKIRVAVVSTIRNARRILEEVKKNPDAYHCVEVMACPGGCIGGGGQPKPTTPEKIDKRIEGLYKIDAEAKMRKAHENQIAKDFMEYAESQPEEKKWELLYRHFGEGKQQE